MADCTCKVRQTRCSGVPALPHLARRTSAWSPLYHIAGPQSRLSWHPRRLPAGLCRCSSDQKASSFSSNATTSTAPFVTPKSAREAVERGQQSFDRKEYAEALRLFKAALDLRPNNDEARAALYNKACAHAWLKDWQEAADDVVRAVNDYGLKLEVAVKVWRMNMLHDVFRLNHIPGCMLLDIACMPDIYTIQSCIAANPLHDICSPHMGTAMTPGWRCAMEHQLAVQFHLNFEFEL